MRLVAISDTHGQHDRLVVPPGDVLVHAGDLTKRGDLKEVAKLAAWLARQPHRHKVVIAGNHDWCFQLDPETARRTLGDVCYLEDSGVELDGIRFWGSPWQPWFLDWAFNLPRGEPLREKWAMIPPGTDVLVTHGPPLGYGDVTVRGEGVGCEELRARVEVLRPSIHIFGHIHEGSGVIRDRHTTYVNAAMLGVDYHPLYPARVIDLAPR